MEHYPVIYRYSRQQLVAWKHYANVLIKQVTKPPEKALDILARKNKSEGSDDEPLGKLPNLNNETPEAKEKTDAVPQPFAQREILSPSKFNVPVIDPEIAPTPEKVQYFAP